MSLITDINELNSSTATKAKALLAACKENKLDVIVIETRRTVETQIIYYLQGRLDVKNNKNIAAEYNNLRRKYRLWDIPVNVALFSTITWTLESKHIEGKAIDICIAKDGKPWWDAPDSMWALLGGLGKKVGLTWGGDWPHPKTDKPHFEDV